MSVTIKSTFLDHDIIVYSTDFKTMVNLHSQNDSAFFCFSIRMLSESGLLSTMETFSILQRELRTADRSECARRQHASASVAAWRVGEGPARRPKCFHSPTDKSPSAYLERRGRDGKEKVTC